MSDLLLSIKEAVIEGEEDQVISLVESALKEGTEARAILDALSESMLEIGERWNRNDIFIPEVMGAADVFQKAATFLEPQLLAGGGQQKLGTIVLGTVQGDLHNLGKNLVAVMLRTAGFNVVDLGVNVSAQQFLEAAAQHQASIIGLSALLTTTMMEQKKVIDLLTETGVRSKYKVMVGGAPISQKWSDEIGSDGYARNAGEAVELARKLIAA
jgi:corrinoid protein of di/trimethylamine methyltransferase